MTQLTDDIYAVEVPDEAQYHRVEHSANGEICELIFYKDSTDIDFPDEIDEFKIVDLPTGTWRIICTTRTATPEQAKEITGEELYPSIALAGLCKAKGLDPNKNYVLLKKGNYPSNYDRKRII